MRVQEYRLLVMPALMYLLDVIFAMCHVLQFLWFNLSSLITMYLRCVSSDMKQGEICELTVGFVHDKITRKLLYIISDVHLQPFS